MTTATATGVPCWFPVDALADYWALPYATVRDELQQRLTLGEIGGVLCAEASASLAWAERRFGLRAAQRMLDDLVSVAVVRHHDEVPLTEEYDQDTDYDLPILI
ncbi:MAG TPA: hypothetical protein H9769_13070 [Candidatus Microbacterium pullistercoris]|nr:hypothetical protein [Candidatus Microbacterium pullistercoris]